nr:hypothetical protein [Tanacetum cinerariifolium]
MDSQNYSLWEVIINGDYVISRVAVNGVAQPVTVLTAEKKLARKNELKACGTLLMALPDKHQLKFNSHKDAKTLMEAIEKCFGGNTETKKVQKTLLKQKFENFTGSSSEDLDQIHDRIQKLTHTLIWINKANLEEHSLDDLFNSLKIYETEVRHSSSPSNPTQNLAFVSSSNIDSTTDSVSAATSVSDICTKLPVSSHPNIDSLSNAVIFSFFASQSPNPQLDNKDLKQIDTGRNLGDNRVTTIGFDMSKVECYNCHRKGHFARECRSPKDTRRTGGVEPHRKPAPVKTSTSNSLVSQCDGIRNYDWSYQAEDEPANFVLMAILSSSSSDNEAALESVESRLVVLSPSGRYHAVPPPITGNFIPPKPDLVFNTAPLAVESDHSAFNVQPIEVPILAVTPKLTIKTSSSSKRKNRKTCFVCKSVDHLIKDCNFHVKPQTKPTPRTSTHRGCNKQYASFTKKYPQKHIVPAAVLTKSKPVYVTAVRQVSDVVPKIMKSRPRPAHPLNKKSNPSIRRYKTHNQFSKTSNSSLKVTAAKVSVDKGVINSGCSRHMTGNMSYFSNFQELNGGYIAFGGNPKGGKISGKGKIKTDFKLPNENQVLLRVPRENNMYNVNLKDIVPSGDLTCLFAKATVDESNLWHRSLGHINFKTINKLVEGNLVRGLPTKVFEIHNTCIAYKKGKQHRASCKTKPVSFVNQPLFRLHMDLFGPTFVKSLNKKNYCLVITDDYGRFTWVFFLATNDETSPTLKNFITDLENQLSLKVKVIRSDNGTEFENSDHNQFCGIKGIKRELSVPRTPQQNGIAERKNKTLTEAARTMLGDSLLPLPFWAEAINTACKFKGKVDEGFLVGYSVNSKSFTVFNSRTRIIQETLHVNFLENKPNFEGTGPTWLFDIDSLTKTMNYQPDTAGNQTNPSVCFQETFDADKAGEEANLQYVRFPVWSTGSSNPHNKEGDAAFDEKEHDAENPESVVNLSPNRSALSGEKDDMTKKKDTGKSPVKYFSKYRDINAVFEDFSEDSSNDVSAASPIVPTARQNYSNSTNPISAAGPIVHAAGHNYSNSTNPISVAGPSNSNSSLTHRQSSLRDTYQPPNMVKREDIVYSDHENVGAEADFNNLETFITIFNDDFYTCMFACFFSQEEPKRVHQALIDPSWIKAMQEELLQFKMHKVWILVDLPVGKKAIGTKWVYRNKKDERGIVVRNKARLIAQGHTQEEGIDYEEVFAPVARIEVIRLFLAYASFMGFMVYQMDVKSAFMYGTIEEEVYVCQPPGFEDPYYPEKVYKVVKELYGLHQALRACQDKYVAEILKKFRLTKGKSASTPIGTEKPLLKDPDGEDVDVHIYRSMIGSLMYLTSSRPDIMFAVCAYARFQVTPKASHLHAVKRIFRYLKGKPNLGLWYLKDSLFDIVAYSDSNYTGASLDRKSTTGGCQFLGCRLISWQCKKQIVVVTSSTEAEYVAGASCCAQVLWIQNQIDALHLDDAEGVDYLPNEEIFTELARMGYEKPTTKLTFYKAYFLSQLKFLIHTILQSMSAKCTSWNEFSSAMASAVICLSTAQTQGAHFPMSLLQKALDACPALARRVEHLEQDKVAQDLEVIKLKTRVKKLKKTNKAKTLKLRRLRKVGTSQRVDTFDDTLMEDVSNQRRVIEKDEDVVKEAHEEAVEVVTTAKLITEVVAAVSEIVSAAAVIPSSVPETISVVAAIPTVTAPPVKVAAPVKVSVRSTRRKRGVVIWDPEEELSAKTPTETTSKDKGKGILEAAMDHVKQKAKEEPFIQRYQVMKKRPQIEAQARRNMMMYLKNTTGFTLDYFKGMSYEDIRPIFMAKFNANMEFLLKFKEQIEEEESRVIATINETSAQKVAKRRKLIEEAKETESIKQHLQIVPDKDDDVFTEATPLARKVPVVDYQTMFERPDGQNNVWRNQSTVHGQALVKSWKLLTSCGVHIISFNTTQIILLVERRYPLMKFTLEQMINVVRLQVEKESEMSLELIRFTRYYCCQTKLMLLDTAAG